MSISLSPALLVSARPAPPDVLRSSEDAGLLRVWVIRVPWLLLVTAWYGTRLFAAVAWHRLTGRGPGPAETVGLALAGLFESAGGGLLKLGQILSTRADLLPAEALRPLARLQDNVRPLPPARILRVVERSLGRPVRDVFANFDPVPLASGSVAQIHRAVLARTGRPVAVKCRRPGIGRAIATDARLVRGAVALLARLPWLDRHPLREAVAEVTGSLVAQSDFLREARNLDRLHTVLKDRPGARAPMVHGELSGPDLITMELIDPPRSVVDPAVGPTLRREAVVTGLRALYRMIFEVGFFHCDLHPGNILLAPDGTVVLVDVGFVGEFGPTDRRAFAEFFLSVALRDSRRAAQVILRTAVRIERYFDPVAFERDIGSLLLCSAQPCAGEFQIVRFVLGLFRVQRAHGLLGSPNFTTAILALLAYEGLIKQTCPDIDFQKEAIPYLMASLQGC